MYREEVLHDTAHQVLTGRMSRELLSRQPSRERLFAGFIIMMCRPGQFFDDGNKIKRPCSQTLFNLLMAGIYNRWTGEIGVGQPFRLVESSLKLEVVRAHTVPRRKGLRVHIFTPTDFMRAAAREYANSQAVQTFLDDAAKGVATEERWFDEYVMTAPNRPDATPAAMAAYCTHIMQQRFGHDGLVTLQAYLQTELAVS